MAKVLFYSEAWGKGGIETFILNVSPLLVKDGCQVSIFSTWEWPNMDDSMLDEYGIQRFTVFHGYKPGQVKRIKRGVQAFGTLLDASSYDAVWINTMNGVGFLYAREAARAGVPIRVVHSHNSDVGDGAKALKRLVSRAASSLWRNYATANISCSKAAGEHLFGDESFTVINNGIDIEKFRYSDEKRNKVRRELGIPDDAVLLGNIGRIASQKNPLFQVKVFAEYKKNDSSAHYLFVGKPDMADAVRQYASELGVNESIIIHAPVSDTSPYYCALDAFLMPSLYEGLGFAEVEAQCASLPVLCTDTMPVEADITDLVRHGSLDDDAMVWAKQLHELVQLFSHKRKGTYADRVVAAGFSVKSCESAVLDILKGATNE